MFHNSTVESIRAFYDRWSTTIFRLSELLVGDKEQAEKATEVAFLKYFRAEPSLDLQIAPLPLLRLALDATRCANGSAGNSTASLRGAIRGLEFDERSVFILRSVLDFEFGRISEITGSSNEQVQRIWLQSLMHLRELLPTEFFKERTL